MLKKTIFYTTIAMLLNNFSIVAKIPQKPFDCKNLEEPYLRARMYLDAKNKYSNDYNGVEILQEIETQCKTSTKRDDATYTKSMYSLGVAYWSGKGTNRDRKTACNYYHEVVKNIKNLTTDPDKNNIRNKALLHIGDGAYWGFCEDKNWKKALFYYDQILAHPENTDTNIIAWAKGRLADAYREGDGVAKDFKKSLALFQEIEDNDANIDDKSIVAWAKYWKAHAYQHGTGVTQNTEKAVAIFTDIAQTYPSHDPIAVESAQEQIDKIHQILLMNLSQLNQRKNKLNIF